MWKYIAFILNLPWTMVGLVLALASMPVSMSWNQQPLAFVCTVKSFWWILGQSGGAHGVAIGNVVLLGPLVQDRDLEHELVHVDQHERLPLIGPLFNSVELLRKGYRDSKHEVEAYAKSDSVWMGGMWKGTIVKESLFDASILERSNVIEITETNPINPLDKWHLYDVKDVCRSDMYLLRTLLKPHGWYAHFWKTEGDMVVVFPNKLFAFTKTNQHGRQLAIDYGISVGIPIEQLSFVAKSK